MSTSGVTAEEMEAYRMRKSRDDDPLAKLIAEKGDEDGLLPME